MYLVEDHSVILFTKSILIAKDLLLNDTICLEADDGIVATSIVESDLASNLLTDGRK